VAVVVGATGGENGAGCPVPTAETGRAPDCKSITAGAIDGTDDCQCWRQARVVGQGRRGVRTRGSRKQDKPGEPVEPGEPTAAQAGRYGRAGGAGGWAYQRSVTAEYARMPARNVKVEMVTAGPTARGARARAVRGTGRRPDMAPLPGGRERTGPPGDAAGAAREPRATAARRCMCEAGAVGVDGVGAH